MQMLLKYKQKKEQNYFYINARAKASAVIMVLNFNKINTLPISNDEIQSESFWKLRRLIGLDSPLLKSAIGS